MQYTLRRIFSLSLTVDVYVVYNRLLQQSLTIGASIHSPFTYTLASDS